MLLHFQLGIGGHHRFVLDNEIHHLDHSAVVDGAQVCCLNSFQLGFCLSNLLARHRHASQFHLNDELETGQHESLVDFLLVVLHHDGCVLVLDIPRTQAVNQVVLE